MQGYREDQLIQLAIDFLRGKEKGKIVNVFKIQLEVNKRAL
jgi:hypothetical protein